MKNLITKGYVALLSVIAISEISSTMITPILAFLFFSNDSTLFHAAVSHADRARDYGYALALGKGGALISSVVLGMAMDKYGRRIVLMLSCAGLAIAMLICAESVDKGLLWMFIFGMLFMNFLYAGKQSGLAMIGDMPKEKYKVFRMSWFQAAIAIGACIGPFLSGHLSELRLLCTKIPYSEPFWLGCGFAIVALIISAVFVSETMNKSVKSNHNVAGYWQLFRQKTILTLFVQVILVQWTWGMYYEFSPAVAKIVFNFSAATIGTYVGLIAFWLIMGSVFLLPFLRRKMTISKLKKLSVSLLLIGVLIGMIATAMPDTYLGEILYWLSPPFAACGDVMFYALIVSEFSNKVPAGSQGKIMGLIYIVLTATWAIAAFIGGHVTAFYVGSTLWLAVVGVVIWLLRSRKYLAKG